MAFVSGKLKREEPIPQTLNDLQHTIFYDVIPIDAQDRSLYPFGEIEDYFQYKNAGEVKR